MSATSPRNRQVVIPAKCGSCDRDLYATMDFVYWHTTGERAMDKVLCPSCMNAFLMEWMQNKLDEFGISVLFAD